MLGFSIIFFYKIDLLTSIFVLFFDFSFGKSTYCTTTICSFLLSYSAAFISCSFAIDIPSSGSFC